MTITPNKNTISGSSQDVHVDYTSESEPGLDTPAPSTIQEGPEGIPLSVRAKSNFQRATLDAFPLPAHDGLLLKVVPPDEPANWIWNTPSSPASPKKSRHVPCDIVLVIDVSGSMGVDAPVPGESKNGVMERNGLTVLDLVKHAARTISETLNENDRLAFVTFSDDAEVVQPLTPMTPSMKQKTAATIQKLEHQGLTNLWKGITEGLRLFGGESSSGRVPSIMVLTDGAPNCMEPPQGYVHKLRSLGPLPAAIHTFGFGYDLRSGLLKSIAEFSGGNYAFIPDAGMLGTVFIHAVANVQSTFATQAVLRLVYPAWVQIDQTMGTVVGTNEPTSDNTGGPRSRQLVIPLGSIQYAQTRDVFLRCTMSDKPIQCSQVLSTVSATLEYSQMTGRVFDASTECCLDQGAATAAQNQRQISAAAAAFHVARARFCSDISSLFPLMGDGEHKAVNYDSTEMAQLREAWKDTEQTTSPELLADPAYRALMKDMSGQAFMAISQPDFFNRWGVHFLPSLQSAHESQQCNSFKDPGPLLYGASSRLFVECRDALDHAFDNLPSPKPSRRMRRGMHPVSMRRYRNSAGVCFASFCHVTLADSRRVRVNRLRRGMQVQTPRGPRTVVAVLKTPVRSTPMVSVGQLLITPWHPISHNAKDWVFPSRDRAVRRRSFIRYTGSIYSVLLQPDQDVDAHALCVEGTWVVTLGHGLTRPQDGQHDGKPDVRVHKAFGDYHKMCRVLASLPVRKDGVVMNTLSGRGFHRLLLQDSSKA